MTHTYIVYILYILCVFSFAAEEHMLYRVFDSLAYEEEETHSFETGMSAGGDLSEEQTRDLMPLISKIFVCCA